MSSHDTNTDMSPLPSSPALVDWHLDLTGEGPAREVAAVRLRELLLRAARFEVFRRSGMLPQLSSTELDDLAGCPTCAEEHESLRALLETEEIR